MTPLVRTAIEMLLADQLSPEACRHVLRQLEVAETRWPAHSASPQQDADALAGAVVAAAARHRNSDPRR